MNKFTLPFISYFLDERFRQMQPGIPDNEASFDWQDIKSTAEKNKVFYWLILELKTIRPQWVARLIDEDSLNSLKAQIRSFRETIKFVDDSLRSSGIDYLLVKTYKNVPYVTQDIDIFVEKDKFMAACANLEANGAKKVKLSLANEIIFKILYQPEEIYGREGILKIDLYRDLSWIRMPSFDYDFLWDNSREADFDGLRFRIPGFEADLVSLIAHSLFWHGDIILLDFLYISWLMDRKLNWELIFAQTSKFGWRRGFSRTIEEIKRVQLALYANKFSPQFPLKLPFGMMLANYREFIARSRRYFVPLVYSQILFQVCVLLRQRSKDA